MELDPNLHDQICTSLRTEVRDDFNIHGTRYFQDAVSHQKSKHYDVVSLPLPLVGQKTHAVYEILTRLVITENPENAIFDGKQHSKNICFRGC